MQSKLARATEEKDFLKQLSDNLLSNQRELQERIRVLEGASRENAGSQDARIKVSRRCGGVIAASELNCHRSRRILRSRFAT